MIYCTFEQLKNLYPTLIEKDFFPIGGTIILQDDSNGLGSYIKSWTNNNPIPTQEQII